MGEVVIAPVVNSLPPFNEHGVLPPGDYPLTIEQLQISHLVTGICSESASWDSEWRSHLVNQVKILVLQLRKVGIQRIWIDGSFVENKDHPHDIDGYFECDLRYFASRQLHHDLNAIDPHRSWTWAASDRLPDPNSAKKQLPMWHRYRVELYPHYPGLLSGILDEHGHNQPFPAAFRKSRAANRPKGIVQLV